MKNVRNSKNKKYKFSRAFSPAIPAKSFPLVSVCIPTFNGDKFLSAALSSIEHQSYRNLEVVISDDSSKDNTLGIVERFKKKSEMPVHVYRHCPSGIGANWNNCIRKANGEYIKFLFQDDILYPSCIEKMVKVLKGDKDIGLVCSKRKFVVEENVTAEIRRWAELYKDLQKNMQFATSDVLYLSSKFFKNNEFTKYPYNKVGEPSAVLFPAALIDKVGPFREDLAQILDYEFYYRILKHKKIAIINEELIGFRLHPLQTTNINRGKPIEDYEKYDRILFEDFFWYLSRNEQKRLLKKYKPKIFTVLQFVRNLSNGIRY